MDKIDIENLKFMTSMTLEQIDQWYEFLSPQEQEYADWLVDAAFLAIDVWEIEQFDNIEDVTEANNVLKRFRSMA